MNTKNNTLYTCNEYREEMILMALKKRLYQSHLEETEKKKLRKEIAELEKKMNM